MHRTLAALACWLVLVSCGRGDPGDTFDVPGRLPIPRPSHNVKDWGPLDYDDTPGSVPGGIVFIKRGDQRIWRSHFQSILSLRNSHSNWSLWAAA